MKKLLLVAAAATFFVACDEASFGPPTAKDIMSKHLRAKNLPLIPDNPEGVCPPARYDQFNADLANARTIEDVEAIYDGRIPHGTVGGMIENVIRGEGRWDVTEKEGPYSGYQSTVLLAQCIIWSSEKITAAQGEG